MTEKQQLQRQAALNEEHFKELFNNLPQPSYVWEQKDGRFFLTDYNRAADEYTGGKIEAFVGKTVDELYSDSPDIIEDIEGCLRSKKKQRREFLYRLRSTGASRRLDVTYIYVAPDCVLVLTEDISERRRQEEKLHMLTEALEQNPDAIFITDSEGFFQYVNPQFSKESGFSMKDLAGKTPRVLKSGNHNEDFYTELWRRIKKGENWRGEFVNKKKSGEEYYVRCSIAPVRRNDGTIQNFVSVQQDITGIKDAERLLIRSERYYKNIIRTTPDGFWVVDDSGNFLDVNEAYCRMSGYRREELLKMKIGDIEYKEDPAAVEKHMKKIFETGYDTFETQHRTKDGAVLDIEISTTFDRKNRRFFVFARDIGERKEMERRLVKLASTDPLTGILNRRHFFKRAAEEISRSRRFGSGLGFITFDIDHFKEINDNFGHKAGDVVLQRITAAVSQALRKIDLFVRLGGEEFGVLLPHTDKAGSINAAERFRNSIEQLRIQSDDRAIRVTISAGVSILEGAAEDIEAIARRADTALYAAKRGGRNRVSFQKKEENE